VALYHQVCKSHLRNKTVDEAFWASFIRFAATTPEFPLHKFALVADFIAMKRTAIYTVPAYRSVLPKLKAETSFTFAGRSIPKLVEMAEASEKELKLRYSIGRRKWSFFLSAGTYCYGEWVVEELTDVDDLFAEGKKMRHCVGSYFKLGYLRDSAIFSIRLDGKPLATIEISRKNRSVVQARGPCNIFLSGEVEAVFKAWAKENNLSC
jgi:hypothetical protein